MPSTLVHAAIGALVAAGLLGREFDWRALVIVVGFAAAPDLDTLLGIWVQGGHRTLLHTILLPLGLAIALYWDVAVRRVSAVRERWGHRGERVGWAAIAALLFAGIGPDLVTNGVNVLYPLQDQFYKISGKALVSDQRGFVQTFVELDPPTTAHQAEAINQSRTANASGGAANASPPPDNPKKSITGTAVGSTEDTHYSTGFDPSAGDTDPETERLFPLVQSGTELLLVALGAFVSTARLRVERRFGRR